MTAFTMCQPAMQIASRYWGFHRPNGTDGGEPEVLVTLAPLLDMTDHAEGARWSHLFTLLFR